MFDMVDTALIIEENWSSANSSGIFQGKKKEVVCVKSEMQILCFYLVGQVLFLNHLVVASEFVLASCAQLPWCVLQMIH